MHSHGERARDNQTTGKQHPASWLPTSSTHMTSSLSSPCLIMDCFISTGGQTGLCLESSDPSINSHPLRFQILRRRSEQHKSILTWFFFFLLEATVTRLYTSKLNWVSAAWVVAVSMATSGPTEHKRWGRHLAMLFIPHHSQKWC